MNPKAIAYLQAHAVWIDLGNGQSEFSLPLDKVQGFLDLLQPGDVPPEKLQRLYHMQATLVREVQRQTGTPEQES